MVGEERSDHKAMLSDGKDRYSLKDSTAIVGQLYPVLKDKHGQVIDGFHRKGDEESWREEKVDQVDTPLKLALARLLVNVNRREVSTEEKTQRLAEIYEEHKKERSHYPTVKQVAGWLGRSKNWVYLYLPDSLKQQEKAKAGRAGGESKSATSLVAEPKASRFSTPQELVGEMVRLRDEDYKYRHLYLDPMANRIPNYVRATMEIDRGASLEEVLKAMRSESTPLVGSTESEPGVGAYVDAGEILERELRKRGIPFLRQVPFKRSDDTSKTYVADFLVEQRMVVEVEEDGTRYWENPKPDQFFRGIGLWVRHYTNREVVSDLNNVATEIVAVLDLVEGAKEPLGTAIDQVRLAHIVRAIDRGIGRYFGWYHIFQKVQVKPGFEDLRHALGIEDTGEPK